MRGIKFFVLVVIILSFICLNLNAEFVDLGSDPNKVEVEKTEDISIEQDFEFAEWSPDGNYFAVNSTKYEDYKSIIYRKKGGLFKRFTGKFIGWSQDSKKVICIEYKLKKLYIYNISTGNRKELNYHPREESSITFSNDNNFLIYFRNKKENKFRRGYIIKKNTNTGSETILFRTPDSTFGYISDFKYFSDDKIFYTKDDRPGFRKVKNILYRLNLNTGEEKKIYPDTGLPIYYRIKDQKVRIEVSGGNFNSFILDENGTIVGKIEDKIQQQLYKNGKYIKPGETITDLDDEIIPNGKLYILNKGTLDVKMENPIDEYIYVYDLKGNSKKLNLPNPTRLISICPSGNQFLAIVSGSYKLITLKRVK